MTELPGLAKEGIKGLGPGAYLVTAVPSVVLVLSLFALASSRLYPFASPLVVDGTRIDPGPPSVVASAKSLELPGTLVLALVVVCTAVLMRPLQLSLVRVLEGYWRTRGRLGFVTALCIESHLVRRSRAMYRLDLPKVDPKDRTFAGVGAAARHNRHVDRLDTNARGVLYAYPDAAGHTMPTALGNVLRRMETTAGERYGLSTLATYPRLYPHISPPLVGEISNQLDVVHTTATFCGIFAVQTLAASPLLLRLDGWTLVPLVFASMSAVAYAGAIRAARLLGGAVETAFDLHRFDMLIGLHLPLPTDPGQERKQNTELAVFLSEGGPGRGPRQPPANWVYAHRTLQRGESVPADQPNLATQTDDIDDHDA